MGKARCVVSGCRAEMGEYDVELCGQHDSAWEESGEHQRAESQWSVAYMDFVARVSAEERNAAPAKKAAP